MLSFYKPLRQPFLFPQFPLMPNPHSTWDKEATRDGVKNSAEALRERLNWASWRSVATKIRKECGCILFLHRPNVHKKAVFHYIKKCNSSLYQPIDTDRQMSEEYHKGIEEEVDDYITSSPNFAPLPLFIINEVKQIITLLKRKSAPGINLTSNVALKHLPDKEVVQLVSIFNASLQYGHFTDAWKKTRVAFIKKP